MGKNEIESVVCCLQLYGTKQKVHYMYKAKGVSSGAALVQDSRSTSYSLKVVYTCNWLMY